MAVSKSRQTQSFESMRFDFFESLSHEEAKTFFGRFLEAESARFHEVLKQCSSEGVPASFGIDSVAPFMRWVAARLKTVPTLGESFVRSFPNLHWTIGNSETAEANMPVVGGFQFGLEMAPILIAENLLRRVIAEPSKQSDIDKAVDYWVGKV